MLPGSEDLAAGGQIELAYHRIRPAPAELNWTQHVELQPVTNNYIRSISKLKRVANAQIQAINQVQGECYDGAHAHAGRDDSAPALHVTTSQNVVFFARLCFCRNRIFI